MKIFLDFNETLVDRTLTEKYLESFLRAGYKKKHIDEAYTKTKGKGNFYSPEKMYKSLTEITGQSLPESLQLHSEVVAKETPSCLYSDTLSFLGSFPKENLILVTYGDLKHQKMEVEFSGLAPFFESCIITQEVEKAVAIRKHIERKHYNDKNIYFVDDRPRYFQAVKKLPYSIKTVWMNRRGLREKVDADYVIENLSQLKDILSYNI